MADEINARAFEEEVTKRPGPFPWRKTPLPCAPIPCIISRQCEPARPAASAGPVSYPACSRKRGFYADIVYHRPGRHTAWGGRARLCRKRAHSGAHAAAGLPLTVATARSPATVVQLLQALPITLPAVLMTGTILYDLPALLPLSGGAAGYPRACRLRRGKAA